MKGQEQRQTARPMLRLADAMAEANGELPTAQEEEQAAPLRRSRNGDYVENGIRYIRCGGGHQVKRRAARA